MKSVKQEVYFSLHGRISMIIFPWILGGGPEQQAIRANHIGDQIQTRSMQAIAWMIRDLLVEQKNEIS
jgi:hypothetical protein